MVDDRRESQSPATDVSAHAGAGPQQVGVPAPRRRLLGTPRRRIVVGAAALLAVMVLVGAVVLALRPAPQLEQPLVMSAAGPAIPAASDCGPTAPDPDADDEPRPGMQAVRATGYAVSTANPEASAAACRVLASGGSAADALIAAQAVLSLVEPQSSGLGGGGFALFYDRDEDETYSFDGMETAPGAAEPEDLTRVSASDSSAPAPSTRESGRSIGVPGIVRLLGDLHDRWGSKSWSESLADARSLAADGFTVSPRLANAVDGAESELAGDPAAADYLLPGGKPVEAGETLRNPDYAATLDALAAGPDGFYSGPVAEEVLASATSTAGGRTPSRMTAEDLSGYATTSGEPICTRYRDVQLVCVPHALESGGVAVAATMGILGNLSLPAPEQAAGDGSDPAAEAAHTIIEAERLALADRSAYSADPAFADPPDGDPRSLLDGEYLRARAAEIEPDRSMKTAKPGKFAAPSDDHKEEGTSHISVVDSAGNIAALTTSLQSNFGSYHLAGGFFLNNHLENFASSPTTEDGEPVANALAGGKRPRSAMSPTLVFRSREDGTPGDPLLATGSPGGSEITSYVVKNLVALLDWGLDPQQAAGLRNFGAVSRSETVIERGWGVGDGKAGRELVRGLESKGPDPSPAAMPSGTATLLLHDDGIVGGADPRREGDVRGGA